MGRKEIPIDIEKVKTLASRGLTHEQIAAALGINPDTLYKRKAKYTEFAEAIKEGQGKGLAHISNALYEQATAGNTSAAIFYLKNRGGWKDKQEVDNTSSDGSMTPTPTKIVIESVSANKATDT